MISLGEIAIGVFSSLIGGGIGYAIRIAVENRRRLRLLGATYVKRNESVRVSAAYLFRIVVRGKYRGFARMCGLIASMLRCQSTRQLRLQV